MCVTGVLYFLIVKFGIGVVAGGGVICAGEKELWKEFRKEVLWTQTK